MKRTIGLILVLITCTHSLLLPFSEARAQSPVNNFFAYTLVGYKIEQGLSISHTYLHVIDQSGNSVFETELPQGNNSWKISWSPNHAVLLAVNDDSSDPLLIFFSATGHVLGQYLPSTPSWGWITTKVNWVSDHEIILAVESDSHAKGMRIISYDLDTHSEITLVDPANQDTHNTAPVISPDGQRILFCHEEFSRNRWLLIADLPVDAQPLPAIDVHNHGIPEVYTVITQNQAGGFTCDYPSADVELYWSPSGRYLLFDDYFYGIPDNAAITVVDPSTGQPVNHIECRSGITLSQIQDILYCFNFGGYSLNGPVGSILEYDYANSVPNQIFHLDTVDYGIEWCTDMELSADDTILVCLDHHRIDPGRYGYHRSFVFINLGTLINWRLNIPDEYHVGDLAW
ncbi:hypothetical protein A2368_04340 [Candidatus Collierbacteria bacterium RIFOXYB1_FULL_49_13]|uniref:Uncharacterized protein n=1 Tax=Candidatus Collierbacteria bacterium RIFOXYB1_FULL_49_13 TaxID=1817728 RepID=A0A1F5FG97_9BACT|nr:MAG: hypothetical protein A2368_04340 [Candidatus Collierbacteria bacterium RIFOXYB1_FULL_49_13]